MSVEETREGASGPSRASLLSPSSPRAHCFLWLLFAFHRASPPSLQLLAFYSSMHSSLLDSFNSTEADNKMSFIIQDLRLLLQNLML